MKASRRILSAILAVLMLISVASVAGAANISFTDTAGHWAWTGGQIGYLVEKGVLNGYKSWDGTYEFRPDGEVTRAEFIKMLDETFGLSDTAEINYSDVKTGDWFYPYFAKAAAQGYILNYGSKADPNGKITREEATTLLARYLDLPSDQKAETGFFPDYSDISENFRDYVLRAVYAGIINGIKVGTQINFLPKKTLTRAEALTILYRAAGCIFNTNSYTRDSGAAETNNVITDGNVILNGMSLNGRVIITEGAKNGSVSIKNCTVEDTLYIRGTADVSLENSKINKVVIENGAKVSALNGTQIKSAIIEKTATMALYSGVKLGELYIGDNANGTKINGDGAIGRAQINAAGFVSQIIPVEFNINYGLSALFAGKEYKGSSDDVASFVIAPFVTSDSTSSYLNLYPNESGRVYYYYTNNYDVPSSADFDSYYSFSNNAYAGSVTVTKNEPISHKLYSLSEVKSFGYIVIQLQSDGRKFAPVSIPNDPAEGNGFTTAPYVFDSTTIKYSSNKPGTLLWYYSSKGKSLTQLEFLQNFNATDAALRGEDSISVLRTSSLDLNKKYLENYKFIAVMIKTANGYYNPVVISVGDTGFAEAPKLKTVGVVEFKSNVDGELYFYYTEDPELPTGDSFKSEYNHADEGKSDIDVAKNREGSFTYDSKLSSEYPYIIVSIKNDDGDFMQPVCVEIDYKTGFRNLPEISDDGEIEFRTEDDGTVYYYYSSSDKIPTSKEFKTQYQNLSGSLRDSEEVDAYFESIEYDGEKVSKYPYMVFMFIDNDGEEYNPVVLPLKASIDSGFVMGPYVSGDKVYFKTTGSGEVMYYYSRTSSSVKPSEFYDSWRNEDKYNRDTISVTKNVLESFEIDDDIDLKKYPYIVLAYTEEVDSDRSSTRFHYPVVLSLKEGSTTGSGIKINNISDDEVSVKTLADGRLYYYFTDSSTHPTKGSFEDKYYSAKVKDYEYCDDGESLDIEIDDDYEYLVMALRLDGSDDIYFEPVVINIDEMTAENENGIDDGSNTSDTGLEFDSRAWNPNKHTFIIVPECDGTVTVSLWYGNTFVGTVAEDISVEEDEETVIDYDGIYSYNSFMGVLQQIQSAKTSLSVQLTSKDGKTIYSSLIIPVPN